LGKSFAIHLAFDTIIVNAVLLSHYTSSQKKQSLILRKQKEKPAVG